MFTAADLICSRLFISGFSIARNRWFVELDLQMSRGRNLPLELRFGPAELPDSPQIPAPVFHTEIRFQDHDILGPTDFHGQRQELVFSLLQPAEIPHPAKVARGEAGNVRIMTA